MNFGTILNSVTKQCIGMIYESRESESKILAREFINYINLKEVLKKQFQVYLNLNDSYIADKQNAKMYVSEVMNTLSNYSFDDIKTYNALLETKFNVPKMKSTDINSDIANLIKYKTCKEKQDPNIFIEAFNNIVEHISTIREEKDLLSEFNDAIAHSSLRYLTPRHVLKIAIKKFNSEYGSLMNEDDRHLFNILRSKDQGRIEQYFSNMKQELDWEFGKIEKELDSDLKIKMNEAITRIKSSGGTETLLAGYELLSELKELNK